MVGPDIHPQSPVRSLNTVRERLQSSQLGALKFTFKVEVSPTVFPFLQLFLCYLHLHGRGDH